MRTPGRNLRQLIVRPDDTLLHAMRVVDREGVEVAFVCDEHDRVVGTLSDGDIRRAILRGVPLESPAVREAMHPNFRWVGPDVGRAEVLHMMRALNIGQIPVLDARGVLIGLHLVYDLIGGAERPNRAVIMAGGKGVRLRPLTENVPKPMLTVAGRPILERLVLHLVSHGIREVFLSVNYLGHMIEEHFGDGAQFGCRIQYLREQQPLGTGGALALLPDVAADPVLVMNGDLVTEADVGQILDFHDAGGYALTTCLRPYQVEIPFGVADVNGARLTAMREKPTQQYLVNAGIYVISPETVKRVPAGREFPITALIDDCLARRAPVGAHVLAGDWIDVGHHETLRQARGQG